MEIPGYTSGQFKLEEGEAYPFEVYNCIRLQDNELYYVLIDINELKHFVAAAPYHHYGIKSGEQIICRVDKINCTGRMFLEPSHPYYKLNNVYKFIVSTCQTIGQNTVLTVKDIFENAVEVYIHGSITGINKHTTEVKCLVKNIRKGVPELEFIAAI